MFEQLVRPFTSRQVTTTRRVVPIKTDDTPDNATITWGTAGEMPKNVVQPKGVNLENIESVGFNIKGGIDKWNQSVRESELVDIPIKDAAGNQIGTTTVDRVKSITFTGRIPDDENKGGPYLPNYTGTADVPARSISYQKDFDGTWYPIQGPVDPKTGLRQKISSADLQQRIDSYHYP
jgi:hypothetical protein